MQTLHEQLVQDIGRDHVISEGEDLDYYGRDRCHGDWSVAPALIVLPRTTAQVQATVRACAQHGAAVVPSGGRTGLAGAAT
ncbi:MAG: FAD-binding protein, partial [Deltaproteobacteria bacterium]|nr:FAD-binding protein [Deltaproteobacteria bacterium]